MKIFFNFKYNKIIIFLFFKNYKYYFIVHLNHKINELNKSLSDLIYVNIILQIVLYFYCSNNDHIYIYTHILTKKTI